jgi:hypothetical protein
LALGIRSGSEDMTSRAARLGFSQFTAVFSVDRASRRLTYVQPGSVGLQPRTASRWKWERRLPTKISAVELTEPLKLVLNLFLKLQKHSFYLRDLIL